MNRRAEVGSLVRTATRRCLELKSLVRLITVPTTAADDRTVAFVCIEAANVWMGFARAYFVSTALRAKLNGRRITITAIPMRTNVDALAFAIRVTNPRSFARGGPFGHRDEPDWQQTSVLARLTSALGASNQGLVRAGISVSTRAFVDLPVFRNFYAHRSEGTVVRIRKVARNYPINQGLHPTQMLCTVLPARPQSLLSDWLDDIRGSMEAMA